MVKTREQLEQELAQATDEGEREQIRWELQQLRKRPETRPRGKDAETR